MEKELSSENGPVGDGTSHDVVGWRRSVVQEAFWVVHEEVLAGQCEPSDVVSVAVTMTLGGAGLGEVRRRRELRRRTSPRSRYPATATLIVVVVLPSSERAMVKLASFYPVLTAQQ
jgi:hypothetical protein